MVLGTVVLLPRPRDSPNVAVRLNSSIHICPIYGFYPKFVFRFKSVELFLQTSKTVKPEDVRRPFQTHHFRAPSQSKAS